MRCSISENLAIFGGLGKVSSGTSVALSSSMEKRASCSTIEGSSDNVHSLVLLFPESGHVTAESFGRKPSLKPPEEAGIEVNVLKKKLAMLTTGIKLLHAQIE